MEKTIKVVGYTFNVANNDFVQIGISEITTKDGIDKIAFYTIGSKCDDFKLLTYDQIHAIHDILKDFSSYKEVMNGQGKSVMGYLTCYIDDSMWDKIRPMLKTQGSEEKA